MYYLKPEHDCAKSFYRKACVETAFGNITLTSYETPVCTITREGHIKLNGLYSRTTTRHIREFLIQHEHEFCDRPEYLPLLKSGYAIKELRKLVKPDTFSKAFNYSNGR